MNILPALAHYVRQQMPDLYTTDGENDILRITDKTLMVNIIQQDNILWLTTSSIPPPGEPSIFKIDSSQPGMATIHIAGANPCDETLLGPTVDIQDPNSLDEVIQIIRHWFSDVLGDQSCSPPPNAAPNAG